MVQIEKFNEQKYDKVLMDKGYKIDEEEQPLTYGYGIRHIQTLIIFLSLCITFMSRAHISATIVAMTDVPQPANISNSNNVPFNNLLSLNVTSDYLYHSEENYTIKGDFKDISTNDENTSENFDVVNGNDKDKGTIIKNNTYHRSVDHFEIKEEILINCNETESNDTTCQVLLNTEQTQNISSNYNFKENSTNFNNSETLINSNGGNATDFEINENSKDYNETESNTTACQILLNSEQIRNTSSSFWNIYRVYDWPKSSQEMVLGSFFLGYMIMMSPMGMVCQRWGGKLPLQISLFSSAIITVLTPWLAVLGDYKAVSMTRVALGLCQAGTYPSTSNLIAKWVPVSERSRLCTWVFTGSMLGAVLAYYVSGFLAVSVFGWPSIFIVIGILCLVMGLAVTFIVSPTPQQNRFISAEEKNFILGGVKDQTEKRYTTPWKVIMTSKPVWACFFAHCGSSTTYLFLFSQIPTYLHHAVGINVKNSGLLSSLPYLANFFLSIIMGILSDYLINNKIMSRKLVRIISNSISSIGPALGMFVLTFISNRILAVSCLIFCMGLHAGTHTGWMVNYIDLAPNFSGTLMATGNTLMNISALLLPVIVSQTVTNMSNVYQWRIVLYIVGTVGLLCNTVYVIFMSTDVQPWNDSEYQPTVQEDPDETEKKTDANNVSS